MAILYGNGDFMKTVGIAVSAGYDCDNQAATVGGLMGVIHGSKAIPDELTKKYQFMRNGQSLSIICTLTLLETISQLLHLLMK